MARYSLTPDCKVDWCSRAAFKGGMCRRHWSAIPVRERYAIAVAAMQASYDVAREHHERLLERLNNR